MTQIDAPSDDGVDIDITDENGDAAGEVMVDDTEIDSEDRALLVEAATLIIRESSGTLCSSVLRAWTSRFRYRSRSTECSCVPHSEVCCRQEPKGQ